MSVPGTFRTIPGRIAYSPVLWRAVDALRGRNFTIADIAIATGLSRSAVHRHLRGKSVPRR